MSFLGLTVNVLCRFLRITVDIEAQHKACEMRFQRVNEL